MPEGARKKDPQDVIDMAKYLKDHPEKWGDYKLLGWNCECFAAFCKIGCRESAQVQEAKKKTLIASGTAAAIIAGSLMVAKSFSGSSNRTKENQY